MAVKGLIVTGGPAAVHTGSAELLGGTLPVRTHFFHSSLYSPLIELENARFRVDRGARIFEILTSRKMAPLEVKLMRWVFSGGV